MKRMALVAVVSVAIVALAAVTRVQADTVAGQIVDADRATMDNSQAGPMPGLRDLYRSLDSATGELWVVDRRAGAHSGGPTLAWGPVFALLEPEESFLGFSRSDRIPRPPLSGEEPSKAYLAWFNSRRATLFVAAGSAFDPSGDPELRVRWAGRDLEAKYVDTDPDTGLAYLVVQLDDGVLEAEERDETPPLIDRLGLNIAPGATEPMIIRDLPARHPGTAGFVTGRARTLPGDGFDELRGESGEPQPGSPVAYGFFVNGKQAVAGIIVAPSDAGGWSRYAQTPTVNAFAGRVATTLADRPKDRAFLGIGTRTSGGATPGAMIEVVAAGSPAAVAGLRDGDVIVSIGGQTIKSKTDVLVTVANLRPGAVADIALLRDGHGQTLQVTLEAATG